MDDFRVTVTGSAQEMDELERFCRKHGVVTERGLLSSYEGVAVTVFALHAIGSFNVVAQCIAEYGAAQGPGLKMSYVVPGKGHMKPAGYSFKAIAEVLRETQQLTFDRESEDAPG